MVRGDAIAFAIVVLSAAGIIWSLNVRYRRQELKHKERMAALEKGAELPAESAGKPFNGTIPHWSSFEMIITTWRELRCGRIYDSASAR